MEMSSKIKEILSSENNLVNEIKRNGFDVLTEYKILDSKIENGLIKDICFELESNPLDTDWEYNGCITLLFEFKEDKIKCQVQSEAITNDIDYSDFSEYNSMRYCDYEEYDIAPSFKNAECFSSGIRCNFSNFYNTNSYKTMNIFKKITEYIIKSDNDITECIETQSEIDDFEIKYYEKVLEEKLDKPFDEITDEEREDYEWEQEGISTYNMMVREGWIDED
jgi:hypothetical protein